MLEHERNSLLEFKIYEVTTCAIVYLRRKLLWPEKITTYH